MFSYLCYKTKAPGILVAQWHDEIGEPAIADGIMNRLVGNAHRLELKGESLQRKKLKIMCKF